MGLRLDHGFPLPSQLREAELSPALAPSVRLAFPPVLLARPGYAGTVAAVRDLGRDRLSLFLLSENWFDCARWSRHVSGSVPTGPQSDPDALIAALEASTGAHRGAVLLPTCDTSAYTYAAHADRLAAHFRVYAPPLATMRTLLDKHGLDQACAAAGIAVLRSWIVRDEAALADLAPRLPYPVIVKPRTHVRRLRNDKGEVAFDQAQLLKLLRQIAHREKSYGTPDDRPADDNGFFVQQFRQIGPEGVLSVTGFIDKSGTRFLARAARKVMLRSEPAGVGVCFEAAPLDPALAEATARLCRQLGYFGAFEVEFVLDGDRWAAIDFNPRFYNQMVLDIARGMPLARLCYYDAIGDGQRLAALVEAALAAPEGEEPLCLRDSFTMSLITVARSLSGRWSRRERARWQEWNRTNAGRMMELVRSGDDPWVWPAHMLTEMFLGLRKLVRTSWERLAGPRHD